MKVDAYRPGRLAVDRRARLDQHGVTHVLSRFGRTIVAVCISVFAVAAAALIFVGALNSDYVCVHKFDLRGNTFLRGEDVIELSGIEEGAGLFSLDLAGAEKALRSDPRIINASVGRKFPDRVVIEVEERRAVGSVVISDVLYKIADDGTVIGELMPEYEDLPFICGLNMKPAQGDVVGMRFEGRELRDALSVLAAVRTVPGLYAKVNYIRADERWFALSGGDVKVFYGQRFGTCEAKRVWFVWRIIPAEDRAGCAMDVRFEGDVIVRKTVETCTPVGGDAGGGEG